LHFRLVARTGLDAIRHREVVASPLEVVCWDVAFQRFLLLEEHPAWNASVRYPTPAAADHTTVGLWHQRRVLLHKVVEVGMLLVQIVLIDLDCGVEGLALYLQGLDLSPRFGGRTLQVGGRAVVSPLVLGGRRFVDDRLLFDADTIGEHWVLLLGHDSLRVNLSKLRLDYVILRRLHEGELFLALVRKGC